MTITTRQNEGPGFGNANIFRLGTERSAIPSGAIRDLYLITGRTDSREARRIANRAANIVAPTIKEMLDAKYANRIQQTAEALSNTENLIEGIRRARAGLDASARSKLAVTVDAVVKRAREDFDGTKELERFEKTFARWEKDIRNL
ncbi:MAG: hypothetical protein LVQ95_02890 [Candidatus Micrarchaeales archaeon]|nr:hypothetical protein [Candidatus Micrarchaeales archaeon]